MEDLSRYIDQTSAQILYHLHFPANHHIKHYIENGIGDSEKQTLKFCEIYNHIQKLKARNKSYEAIEVLTNSADSFSLLFHLNLHMTKQKHYKI